MDKRMKTIKEIRKKEAQYKSKTRKERKKNWEIKKEECKDLGRKCIKTKK